MDKKIVSAEVIAFWQTAKADIKEMQAIIDELAHTPAQQQKLHRLLEWSMNQRSFDEAYNASDFSGN